MVKLTKEDVLTRMVVLSTLAVTVRTATRGASPMKEKIGHEHLNKLLTQKGLRKNEALYYLF